MLNPFSPLRFFSRRTSPKAFTTTMGLPAVPPWEVRFWGARHITWRLSRLALFGVPVDVAQVVQGQSSNYRLCLTGRRWFVRRRLFLLGGWACDGSAETEAEPWSCALCVSKIVSSGTTLWSMLAKYLSRYFRSALIFCRSRVHPLSGVCSHPRLIPLGQHGILAAKIPRNRFNL